MKTVAHAPRRKYQFASRQEAEEHVSHIGHKAHQQLRLSRALYTGNVQWATTPYAGPYRVGIFDLHTPGGPRLATSQ